MQGGKGKLKRARSGVEAEMISPSPSPSPLALQELRLRHFALVVGKGRSQVSLLNAFDAALLDAGIAHYNLVRVSSVLPPGATERAAVELPPGALLPIAYGSISSAEKGHLLTAAVAAALPQHQGDHGVIMEYSGHLDPTEAKELVEAMAQEAMELRALSVKEIKTAVISSEVELPTCVLAGVALF